jgi:hypothetical protein
METTIPDLNRKKLNKLFQVDIGFDVPEGQGKVLTSMNLKTLLREVSKQVRLRNNDAHRYQFPEQKDKNGGVDRLIIPA